MKWLAILAVAVAAACHVPTADPYSGPSAETVAWVSRTAIPLATTEPTEGLADLAPLRAMVGNARLVGLGEATNGTREFFQMKHRMLRYLVSELGFTLFAIEATSPEADDVNRYVLTGAGDPTVLLSRLYFWQSNADEMLDLVRWMREWNATAPPDRRVEFRGFDMQYAGASIDSVVSFVARVDPSQAAFVRRGFACLDDWRNQGPAVRRLPDAYPLLADSAKLACKTSIDGVRALLASRQAAYVAASSSDEYERVTHHVRLAQQFHEYLTVHGSINGVGRRDGFLAENVAWLLARAKPGTRAVLWSHNAHVAKERLAMGAHLDSAYAGGYVALGLSFALGRFHALAGGTTLATMGVPVPMAQSLEETLYKTGAPRLLLDLRQIPGGGAATEPLHEVRMRSIGETYDPASPDTYYHSLLVPHDLDLLVYLQTTTESHLRPFTY